MSWNDFTLMAKPAGPSCNLRCAYCFYLGKQSLFPGNSMRMSDAVLREYVRAYLALHPGPGVPFAWQGGEPTLMGLDFFRRAFELQAELAPAGKRAANALQTNGLLLDDAWCSFLAANNVLVGLSLDGTRALHDRHRVDSRGQGTYACVVQSLERLQAHGAEVNALVTVNAANEGSGALVYRHLTRELGLRHLQFIPIVEPEPGAPAGVSARSVSSEGWGRFLLDVFAQWRPNDVGRVFVQIFDAALGAWLGVEGGFCAMRERCGRSLVLEHDGGLYPCDHFVSPATRLGNILETPLEELLRGTALARFGQMKRARLPGRCRACPVLFACRGGCPKDRLQDEPYLCAGNRLFFQSIDAPMRAMAQSASAGASTDQAVGERPREQA